MWRQHRRQLWALLTAMAVLAAVLGPTGMAMHHAYDRLGLASCTATVSLPDGCPGRLDQFTGKYDSMFYVAVLLLVLPLLAGLFWGAPVVAREVEQGTHRLIWTQGITRRRWALTKIGVLTGVVAVAAAGYGLGTAWWLAPLSRLDTGTSRFAYLFFDMQGVAPVAYTVFAVVLGIAAGTTIPRTIPAMGLTLAVYAGVRTAVEMVARPRFAAPEQTTFPVASGPGSDSSTGAGSWVLAHSVHQADGTFVTDGSMRCPVTGCSPDAPFPLQPGAYNLETFQPADRFWAFQWLESGIFVLLAAVLIGWTVHRLRRLT
ncbi:transmembrane transport protein [Actinoplanes sp. N902-109]|nr:transmembrane transport protein [Actinoplanes sp. N902-109]